ncbi:hypothetical protein Tco_0862719, partial [Tanacetum coccineum]
HGEGAEGIRSNSYRPTGGQKVNLALRFKRVSTAITCYLVLFFYSLSDALVLYCSFILPGLRAGIAVDFDMMLVLPVQNRRDLPRDTPLNRIEVLRYGIKGVKVRKGIMQTKTELRLEQTQQGASDEVLISIEGVEELKEITGISTEVTKTLSSISVDYHLPKPAGIPDDSSSYHEVLKLKNFKKDEYTIFQDEVWYEHVVPKVTRSQEGKRSQDDEKR